MVEVIDATDQTKDTPDVPEVAAVPSKAQSILDQIRSTAKSARANLWVDVPLPDTVPGDLSLRLGVPTTVVELAFFPANGAGDRVDRDLADLSSNIIGVVVDGELVDGLTAKDIAAAYAEQIYGAQRPITDDRQAILELHSAGEPPSVNAAALRSNATLYRVWSTDPTPPRTSDQAPSE